MDMGFIIKRSKIGDYWQVRARDLRTGEEETVDRLYSLEEVEEKKQALISTGWINLG